MRKLLLFLLLLITLPTTAWAQDLPVEMADTLRSNGKIYVVVVVLVIVLLGVLGYLFFLERKVARLEKMANELERDRPTDA